MGERFEEIAASAPQNKIIAGIVQSIGEERNNKKNNTNCSKLHNKFDFLCFLFLCDDSVAMRMRTHA